MYVGALLVHPQAEPTRLSDAGEHDAGSRRTDEHRIGIRHRHPPTRWAHEKTVLDRLSDLVPTHTRFDNCLDSRDPTPRVEKLQ